MTTEPLDQDVFAPAFEALPNSLPIFPLAGVLLLPRGRLPLNVFEPRYLAMIEDALGHGRMIGMIQPAGVADASGLPPLYSIGCVGRIANFSETEDGRFLISLVGVCRFHMAEELPSERGYRRVRPDWTAFQADLEPDDNRHLDRQRLFASLRHYFRDQGIMANWEAIEQTPDERLITSLSMICPFAPPEKQALLESPQVEERGRLLTALIEMANLHQSAEEERPRH